MVQAEYDYSRRSWEQEFSQIAPVKTSRKSKRVKPNKKALRNLYFKIGLGMFVYAIILVILTLQSASLGYQIVALESEIEQYQVSNARLDYEIAQLSSLAHIETKAFTELGMKKPDMSVAMTIPTSTLTAVASSVQEIDTGEEKVVKPLEKVYSALLFLADKTQ